MINLLIFVLVTLRPIHQMVGSILGFCDAGALVHPAGL